MQIPVNKNLDEYKDDFYKGLTLKQTVLSVLTITSGTGIFFVLYSLCHLDQTVSLYLSVPAALPFAVAGFLRIHGMSLWEYVRRKRLVMDRPVYVFQAELLNSDTAEEREVKIKEYKNKKILLATQEEAAARMRGIYEETNEGL